MSENQVSIIAGRSFESEFVFNASRSSGPGGQHVNKVSTKIELRFDITASRLLQEEEKIILKARLASRITKEGILILVSQSERSQYDNKEKAVTKFYKLLQMALTPARERKPTRPTSASRTKRLTSKHRISEKKTLRKSALEE